MRLKGPFNNFSKLGYTCGCANDELWDETVTNNGACDSKCVSDVTKVCGGQTSASVYKSNKIATKY